MSTTTEAIPAQAATRRVPRRRPLRALLWAVIALLALVVAAPAGFLAWSMVRESKDFRVAAGEGARFVDADGLAIHYRSWGPEDGRPLVLAHGSLAWGETFRDIAAPLGERGFRVIAPDIPPFGFSQRPEDHDYSRAAGGRRILAFADALGLERFVLGVHSHGGGAALEAALAAPERIEALVLLDVALGLGQTETSSPPAELLLDLPVVGDAVVASTFANPLLIGYGLSELIHDDALVTSERIALYERPYGTVGFTDAVRRWLGTGLYGDERQARSADPASWQAFRGPVLVIWGREDSVTPLDQGRTIAERFPGGALRVLDGVNHIPHVEKPDDVVRLVASLMEALRIADEGPMTAPKMPRLTARRG
ncbi:MAG: alpha/beta fold hydrolase [Rhizobiaceae bacterium]